MNSKQCQFLISLYSPGRQFLLNRGLLHLVCSFSTCISTVHRDEIALLCFHRSSKWTNKTLNPKRPVPIFRQDSIIGHPEKEVDLTPCDQGAETSQVSYYNDALSIDVSGQIIIVINNSPHYAGSIRTLHRYNSCHLPPQLKNIPEETLNRSLSLAGDDEALRGTRQKCLWKSIF